MCVLPPRDVLLFRANSGYQCEANGQAPWQRSQLHMHLIVPAYRTIVVVLLQKLISETFCAIVQERTLCGHLPRILLTNCFFSRLRRIV